MWFIKSKHFPWTFLNKSFPLFFSQNLIHSFIINLHYWFFMHNTGSHRGPLGVLLTNSLPCHHVKFKLLVFGKFNEKNRVFLISIIICVSDWLHPSPKSILKRLDMFWSDLSFRLIGFIVKLKLDWAFVTLSIALTILRKLKLINVPWIERNQP